MATQRSAWAETGTGHGTEQFDNVHFLNLQVDGNVNFGNGSPIRSAEVVFTESAEGTHTGSVTIPAGATIIDIQVQSTVLWAAATSAVMKVGDAADDDGFYTGINLKATDLLVAEVIRFASTGGKEGAYIVTATGELNSYSASSRVITGVVTQTGAGTAGRTRMTVIWSQPAASKIISATYAA